MEAPPPESQSPPPDAPSEEADPTPPKSAVAARPRVWVWLAVLMASLVGLGAAGFMYRSYAAVHLRRIAKMPRCVLLSNRGLSKPSIVSGSEAYPTPEGEVYLTPSENRAVSCLEQRFSKPLAVKFALAFAEHEPEIRGLELLKTVRDLPPDPSADREATAAYFIASAALRGLPELPETTAARDELRQLHACRFDTRTNCPTRPSIPILVWVSGIPSAAGFCISAFVFGLAGFRIARDRIRTRRERRKRLPPADSGE